MTTKTVKKALDILELFLSGKDNISISEITKLTGQNISTVHNILITLVQYGYIIQCETRGKYSLGLKFLSFGDAINRIMTIEKIVHPYIVELSDKVDETVNIAILNKDLAVNISVIHSTHLLRVNTNPTKGVPLYCTGVGKVFLAGMNDEELDQYLSTHRLVAKTTKTITSKRILRKEIQKIRLEDIAYDIDEFETGIHSIAHPLKDFSGATIAVIGVLGPSVRLSFEEMQKITPLIKRYASVISSAMGNINSSVLHKHNLNHINHKQNKTKRT